MFERILMLIGFVTCIFFAGNVGAESTLSSTSVDQVTTSNNTTSVASPVESVVTAKSRVKYMSGFSNDSSVSVTSNTTVQEPAKTMTPEEIDKEFKEKYKPLRSQ